MKWGLRKPTLPQDSESDAIPPAVPDATARVSEARDGAVWVEGGVLHVRNPTGLGRWPSVVVSPGAGLRLEVNGEPVSGEVVLRAEDAATVVLPPEERPARIEVEIAGDGLAAWVTVREGEETRPVLEDAKPTLRLTARATRQPVTRRHAFVAADVRAALADAGVRFGVQASALAEAVARPGERVRVATGRAPCPGRDGRAWSVTAGDRAVAEGEGRRTAGALAAPAEHPYAQIGQPVAQITPADPGRRGQAVTGEQAPPPPVWQPRLVLGRGVLASSDGRTAIAAVSGHPEVVVDEDRVYAAVFQELRIEGDLGRAAGDVVFQGDIWVSGDVRAAAVRAAGSIEVGGRVTRGRLEAGGSIRIAGGVTGSVLVAGGPGIVYFQALGDCRRLTEAIVAQSKDGRPAAASVTIRNLTRHLQRSLAEAEVALDPEVTALARALAAVSRAATIQAWAALPEELGTIIATAMERMQASLARPGKCYARFMESTRVAATGAVLIGETGTQRSHVVTLGAVECLGTFRSGTVWAAGGARFAALGGNDAEARVEIGATAPFYAGQVHRGAVLVRGEEVREFGAPAARVAID